MEKLVLRSDVLIGFGHYNKLKYLEIDCIFRSFLHIPSTIYQLTIGKNSCSMNLPTAISFLINIEILVLHTIVFLSKIQLPKLKKIFIDKNIMNQTFASQLIKFYEYVKNIFIGVKISTF